MKVLRSVLLLVALPALGGAQDPPDRGRAFGLVRDRAGRPWSEARVTLLSRPLPGDERIGEPDRIEVVSDQQGRFRAAVLPNRPYSVWAIGDDGGRYRHSGIVENVFPNVPVVLDEAGSPRPRRQLRLEGLAKWRHRAPLRLRVVGSATNVEIAAVEIDPQGTAQLPALAGTDCLVEVYAAGGQRLLEQEVALDAGDDPRVLAVPEPYPMLVAVRDRDGSTPLAGARVLERVREHWVPIGETGGDGIAVLELAVPRNGAGRAIWRQRPLLAVAPGHSPGAFITVRMDLSRAKDPTALRARGEVDAYAGLQQAPPLRGRLVAAPGIPMPETDLVLYGRYTSFRNGSSTAGPLVLFARTDALGRFSMPSPQIDEGFRLCAVIDGSRAAAMLPDRSPPHPVAMLAHDGGRVPASGDLGEIRIDGLCAVDISVTRSDRTPAPHAMLAYTEHSERSSNQLEPIALVADRHGRQRVLVPATDDLVLGAVHRGSGQVVSVELSSPTGIADPVALDLRLAEPSAIRGRVRDADGIAISGALVSCFPVYRSRGTSRVTRPSVRLLPVDQNAVRVIAHDRWDANGSLTSHLLQELLAYSDDRGEFVIVVPTDSVQYFIRAGIERDDAEHQSSMVAVRLRDRQSERVDLTIELR